jgi:hypothetical protein
MGFGLAFAACNDKSDDSAGSIGEADADADTDGDTDTDTDADWTAIEGSLDYDFVVNGNTLCDATVDFTGHSVHGAVSRMRVPVRGGGRPRRGREQRRLSLPRSAEHLRQHLVLRRPVPVRVRIRDVVRAA